MEDNNQNTEFRPSPVCRAWSKASAATSLAAIFASIVVPASTPVFLALGAVFTAKAVCLSVKERKAHKHREENKLNPC